MVHKLFLIFYVLFLKDKIKDQDLYYKLDASNYKNLNTNFKAIIEEINLHSQYVHTIDENLKHITFNVLDICGRNHCIKIYIPEDYPKIKKKSFKFEVDVPLVAINSLLMVSNLHILLILLT